MPLENLRELILRDGDIDLDDIGGGGGLSEDYVAALGKVTATGVEGEPTLFDTASTLWSDGPWWRFKRTNGQSAGLFLGCGYDIPEDNAVAYAEIDSFNDPIGGVRGGGFEFQGQTADGDSYGIVIGDAWINAEGTGRAAFINGLSDLAGQWYLQITDSMVQLLLKANADQTLPLLDLQDSTGAQIFEVTGDNKIGFYNAAPVAQQTGVTVDAAGIHAALVALGLFTA